MDQKQQPAYQPQPAAPPGVWAAQPVPPPSVYQVQPVTSARPSRVDDYKGQRSVALGAIQIVGAIIAIILNIVGWTIQIRDYMSPYDHGGWTRGSYQWDQSIGYFTASGLYGGLLLIISGSFAIAAGRTKSRCLIITQFVMSIIAGVLAGLMLCMAAWLVAHDAHRQRVGYQFTVYEHNSAGYESNYITHDGNAAYYGTISLAVSVLFLLASLVELVCCIWSSSLAYSVCCCGPTTTSPEPTATYVTVAPGQQVVMLGNYGQASQLLPPAQQSVYALPPAEQGVQPLPPVQQGVQPLPPAQQGVQPLPPAQQGLQPLPPAHQGVQPLPPAHQGLQTFPSIQQYVQATPTAPVVQSPLDHQQTEASSGYPEQQPPPSYNTIF